MATSMVSATTDAASRFPFGELAVPDERDGDVRADDVTVRGVGRDQLGRPP